MLSRARRYCALVLFFVLAYLFAWLIWGPEGRFEGGGLLAWLGSAGPALAAIVVTALSQGRRGPGVMGLERGCNEIRDQRRRTGLGR